MKRILGLLALMLVPALLTIPTAAPAQAVGAKDFTARSEKILGLAAQAKWAEVAKYTNPKMLAWLKARDHEFDFTPACKKSVASRPGKPVYACRYQEKASEFDRRTVPAQWWIFYRQVEGKWTLVNERIITSATAFRTRQSLLARAKKIWDLATAHDWAAVGAYATTAGTDALKDYVELQESAEGPFDPAYDPSSCDQVVAKQVAGYGAFNCLLPQNYDDDAFHGLAFKQIAGTWKATDVVDLEVLIP